MVGSERSEVRQARSRCERGEATLLMKERRQASHMTGNSTRRGNIGLARHRVQSSRHPAQSKCQAPSSRTTASRGNLGGMSAAVAPILKTTPFHARTAPLIRAQTWRRWSGYQVASAYEAHPDREYAAIRNAAALLDVSP